MSDPSFWHDSNTYWRDKRVVVTGGAGFLGSFVVEKLQVRGAAEILVPRIEEYDPSLQLPIPVGRGLPAVAGQGWQPQAAFRDGAATLVKWNPRSCAASISRRTEEAGGQRRGFYFAVATLRIYSLNSSRNL